MSWVGITITATANEMIVLALDRIKKKDVRDYRVFIDMLNNVTGMDQVVSSIESNGICDQESVVHVQYWPLTTKSLSTYSYIFTVGHIGELKPHPQWTKAVQAQPPTVGYTSAGILFNFNVHMHHCEYKVYMHNL